jgi:hypothetical protein
VLLGFTVLPAVVVAGALVLVRRYPDPLPS